MIRKLPMLAALAVANAATALLADVKSASAEPIIAFPTLAQPDLVVESVTTSPPYYSTTITIKNLNSGLTFAAGQFLVRVTSWYYVSCYMFCSQPSGFHQDGPGQGFYVWSLKAGETVSLTFPPVGSDWVKVEVDPLNQVAESNKNDNTYFGKPTYTY